MPSPRVIPKQTLTSLACALLLLAPPAAAAPGDLDGDFAGDGIKTVNVRAQDFGTDVLVQNNGKLLAVGSADTEGDSDFAIARFKPNGVLDQTFSNDGKKTTDFGADDHAGAVLLLENGKIVVIGSTGDGNEADIAMARYRSNGTLDPKFGGDGKKTTDLGNLEFANDAFLLPNGKMIVVGNTNLDLNTSHWLVARYRRNGKLDTNEDSDPNSHFSQDGYTMTEFGDSEAYAYSVDVQHSRITVAGETFSVIPDDMAIGRFKMNGQPDDDFSDDGKQTVSFTDGYISAHDVDHLPNGKTILLGYADADISVMAFVRLQSDGEPDLDFSDDGIAAFAYGFTGVVQGRGLVVQPDGKYVGVGNAIGPNEFIAMRVKKNGELDPTFGEEGQVTTDVGSGSQAQDVEMTPNDQILSFGKATFGTDDFALVRIKSGL
jgi:uncharacterized delta-60 repeat protein